MSGTRPWGLWRAQVLAILRLEVKKNLARKRAIPVYLLAASPLLLYAGHSIAYARGWVGCGGSEDLMMFAGVFQVYVLRLAIFFSAVAIFMNLFRGEVMEKSLHYYFLAPVRREVLVEGKYLSGLVTTALLFGLSTTLSYLILLSHMKLTASRALAGAALGELPAYLGVTVLACLGYGAVFLIMGLLFRNPIVPTVTVLVWESIVVFLPSILKKISVIFYLESLCPVKVPFRGGGALFAISADPTPAYLAVPGLLCLTVVVVILASLAIRRMEIRYGTE
jgi:ABC-type transport system involved in multi-copper enzyme maturation permease subunit